MSHKAIRKALELAAHGIMVSDEGRSLFLDVADVRALLAERDAMKAMLEEALIWHESQDKAISKQPNANTGSKGWMRASHQEQADMIRAALAQEQGEKHDNQD